MGWLMMCSSSCHQELWLPTDFEELATRVKSLLPHSVYYKAGIIGGKHQYSW